VQAIQKVFTALEWVKVALNEARVEANHCAQISKALGAAEQKKQELVAKLKAKERGRNSAEANLKNA